MNANSQKNSGAENGRKDFFTRLPAATYRKLRQLASLDDVEPTEKQVGTLFRIPLETHQRLRRISLRRSLEGTEMTMQSMLTELIEKATSLDIENCHTMSDAVRQLIEAEPQ